MKSILTDFSVKHPWIIIGIAAIATVIFALQFPKVQFDNDPENMLAEDEPVRVFHNEVKERYKLYDFVIVGIVNEEDPQGVFNVETLNRIHTLTNQLINLHQNEDGKPAVTYRNEAGEKVTEVPELESKSKWHQFLNFIFQHHPSRLFEDGESVIIAPEIISPSVVDNIKQAELGSLKIEYLMEEAPETAEEAATIKRDAMNNPLYKGTLVSEDGKALALYIPIKEKHFSYNVANLVRKLTADWPDKDRVYITGLPVAEDTFGVEMLIQMATSAPMAGLVIFVLLFVFFRKLQLIIAPMVIAMISVICAMGLLIGLGYDVHIMSSMIAIFLMPIAVTDSVHMLSEFYDTYQKFQDKAKTIRHVVGHLFMPMLYTSLTTMAGFASLATTPIPPVKVFGLHVAFGVAIAWLLTITFVPAYIMIFVSEKSLQNFGTEHGDEGHNSSLMRLLEKIGYMTYKYAKPILGVTALVIAVSIFGITKININDNPVKWFTEEHEIRVADEVLNEHFGGTYTAYLTLAPETTDEMTCREKVDAFRKAVADKYGDSRPAAAKALQKKLDELDQLFDNVRSCDPEQCFSKLLETAQKLDQEVSESWNKIADEVLYLDPDGLDYAKVKAAVEKLDVDAQDRQAFLDQLEPSKEKKGEELQNAALKITDNALKHSVVGFLRKTRTELEAPPFKRPEVLHYVQDLQQHLMQNDKVGKTSSAVDAMKKAHYELNFVPGMPERNERNFSIPDSAAAAGQVYIQLEGMKKKDSLFHLVTKDYERANIWVQLKSGDNKDMEAVLTDVEEYMAENPPPADLQGKWAGLTYINVIWQDKMVTGMLSSLAWSGVVVFVMMLILFRSPIYGLLSMIPLSVTIAFIYGLIGIVGKDYDMPVAVLSSLTLGLSVDFAIHFLERTRETVKQYGSWKLASGKMFGEPAAAITRNGIVIAIGFTPLLLAPLVPYKTVGFFLATIMAVSGIGTLLILPALITIVSKWMFRKEREEFENSKDKDQGGHS